jgi:peptidoglycan biosynthesis protein MviN/MurJ (putative lipid II flippase)
MPEQNHSLPSVSGDTIPIPEESGHVSRNRSLGDRILSAGFALLAAGICVRLCGLFSNNLILNEFGGEISDVFVFVSSTVLGTAFNIGEQCLSPALLPIFTRAWEKEGEARAWRYISIIFNLQFIILLVLILSLIFFAKPVISLLTQWDAPKIAVATQNNVTSGEIVRLDDSNLTLLVMDQERVIPLSEIKEPNREWFKKKQNELPWKEARRELGGKMLPYVAPGLLGMSLASLTYSVLIGQKQSWLFFFASFGDAVLKLCIFLGALLGAIVGKCDWRYIGAGAVLGGTGKLVTHLMALGRERLRHYRFTLDLRDPYVGGFFLLVLPLVAGIVVSSARDLVINNVLTAQPMLPTYYKYGRQVIDAVAYLIPFSLSIALLPFFCDLAARNDNKRLGEILTQTIRMLLWFFIPITIVMAVAALPVCQVIYAGKFMDAGHLSYPALVMKLFALQMPFAALEMMVMQAFVSNRRVIAPTIAGFIFSIFSASLAYWLVIGRGMDNPMQILLVIVLCVVMARIFKVCLLVVMLKTTVPVLPLAENAGFIGKLIACGVAAAGGAYGAVWLFHKVLGLGTILKNPHVSGVAETTLICLACGAAYLACCILLKMEEPGLFWRWTREKLAKRKQART